MSQQPQGGARPDIARLRAHMPEGTNRFLNTRSLANAHRRLAELLHPGLTVLDIGCGAGAITRGIAEAVAPDGRVIGVDINRGLIEEARRSHGDVLGLSFEVADFAELAPAAFDIVTAARMLQWLADPLGALRAMAALVRPGGRVVVLDYNHERIAWQPEPPASMVRFYQAFLRWRADVGMDNAIADHLSALFAEAGLVDIVVTAQHEATQRADPDFATRVGLWADVAATRGHQMVADGAVTEQQRATAEVEYRDWMRYRRSAEAVSPRG
jgi:ubiquinone/menaquinone biosynthesis C-methylase UbiE